MPIERTDKEIDEQVSRACDQIEEGVSRYPKRTYEEGVRDALDWVIGMSNDEPFLDED